ncbi:DUF3696 domain-containing protein [Aliarcobacter cryaerophilus]|uniref:DUF3696 domain-containing protein n=1 Tax=Aliarcobacter cryaerophilus TaxID=28198 RepID=A0A7G9LRM3_9BACT|nr:DUF3696 domain-containing protein [Aliarcobacter cryaerophilus]QNM91272.1 DUF3696 domain-containing protein [Aliarcobacter cryaerophilus]
MKKIRIKNFKSFEDEDIYFEKLTVLTGGNGVGKSTVIQSLLILLQSFNKKDAGIIPNRYYLNDYYCELGSSEKLLYKDANEDYIYFTFYDKNDNYSLFKFEKDKKDKNIFNLIDLIKDKDHLLENKSLNFLKYFEFIGADRFGPRTFHHTDSNYFRINVGKYGEYTTLVLNMYKDEILDIDLPKNLKKASLLTHVNYWLERIFGFVQVDTDFIDEANIAILKIKNDYNGDYHTPVNMPYGISYVLPIIVSCLVRLIDKEKLFDNYKKEEDSESEVIVIENPEAHLHPSAQSMIGIFLSYIAEKNIQIIVETHSDHVLNGIRKAIKSKIINHKEVVVNFFELKRSDEGVIRSTSPKENIKIYDHEGTVIHEIPDMVISMEINNNINHTIVNLIEINEQGELEEWPQGFFDQFEKDMMELL